MSKIKNLHQFSRCIVIASSQSGSVRKKQFRNKNDWYPYPNSSQNDAILQAILNGMNSMNGRLDSMNGRLEVMEESQKDQKKLLNSMNGTLSNGVEMLVRLASSELADDSMKPVLISNLPSLIGHLLYLLASSGSLQKLIGPISAPIVQCRVLGHLSEVVRFQITVISFPSRGKQQPYICFYPFLSFFTQSLWRIVLLDLVDGIKKNINSGTKSSSLNKEDRDAILNAAESVVMSLQSPGGRMSTDESWDSMAKPFQVCLIN